VAKHIDQSFERRKREQLRTARAAERRNRKAERAAAAPVARSGNGEDPDLAGIVVGPQPRDIISEQEARRAVERAMNPGALMQGEQARSAGTSEVFVGNLDFNATDDELRKLFVAAGFTVVKVSIAKDRSTGQPRGFAFVEVQGFREAASAVKKLDGTEVAGRRLRLNVAEEKARY
jgi:hypothetical protein